MTFFYTLVVAQLATQITHALSLKKSWGPVRASSSVTLSFVLLTTPFSLPLISTLRAACLGATFVGMSDPKRMSAKQLAMASFAFTLIFHYFIHHLKGLGGALGFSAFVSCVAVYLLHKLLK